MAIGERIRFIRNLRGMTQKWLGQAVGFPQKTADIRMAQYESGSRTPKEDLVNALANVLEVSPLALSIPDIDSDLGFIHTLFAVEDIHGVRAEKQGDEVHIVFDGSKRTMDESIFKMLSAWADQAEKLKNGEISKDDMYLVPLLFSSHTMNVLDSEQRMDKAQIAVNVGDIQSQRSKGTRYISSLMAASALWTSPFSKCFPHGLTKPRS